LENELMLCWTLEQAPTSGAPRMSPSADLRVAERPVATDFPVPFSTAPDWSV
jgi:hypothetical protein